MSRWLALAMAIVWVVAVASAEAVLTPAMHCHDMPCCPRSDGGMQSCSTAQCAEQVPEKAEAQSAAKEPVRVALSVAAMPAGAGAPRLGIRQMELTPGLRPAAAVFRLKDDLRI
jgi:hypothetical protein